MKYKIKKGFIIQKLDEKAVIFDSEESILYTLNETATFIFQKLRRGLDKEQIIQALVKKYQIEEKRASEDVDEFIFALKEKKIISSAKTK